MIVSVCICIACFFYLVTLLRRAGFSLGLPIAYLFALLFIHVPGAIAHIAGGPKLTPDEYTETGIWYTAIGAMAFLAGIWIVHRRDGTKAMPLQIAPRQKFAIFCLVTGLAVTYGLLALTTVPTLGAITSKAGGIWVLGVIVGLTGALRRGAFVEMILWLAAMTIFPVLTLLQAGFLSFGSTPVFVILSRLAITTRNTWRVHVGIILLTLIFFHLFLSYFTNRDEIRNAVWGGAQMDTRIQRSLNIVTDLRLFNPDDHQQMAALDQRLNQNYFVGLAKARIDSGTVEYLHGRSISEGVMALVPRAFWPDKPVTAGSPHIITEMTGFKVNSNTSYGVGNVMEFYINFGMTSLILGFLLFGLLLGWLDRRAALAEREGNLGNAILYFLPALAMIQPNGSMVEITSGGAAALLAALGWRWMWNFWSRPNDAVEAPRRLQKKRIGNSSALPSDLPPRDENPGPGENHSGESAHA